jgi:hypothetical protein
MNWSRVEYVVVLIMVALTIAAIAVGVSKDCRQHCQRRAVEIGLECVPGTVYSYDGVCSCVSPASQTDISFR